MRTDDVFIHKTASKYFTVFMKRSLSLNDIQTHEMTLESNTDFVTSKFHKQNCHHMNN
jgi:hypothetical protein